MSHNVRDYVTLRDLINSNHAFPVLIEQDTHVYISADIHGLPFSRNILKNNPPSGDFAALLSDHWVTRSIEQTANGVRDIGTGSDQTEANKVTVVGIAAQPEETKVLGSVTPNTITYSSPLVNSQLTAPTSVGDYTVPVVDSTGFYIGMRVIIEEAGKPFKKTYVEAINGNNISLMSSIDTAYTTSAILRQCVRGRDVYVNSGESLKKFPVIACSLTSITLLVGNEDLTTLTAAGKSCTFTEEIIKVKGALGGADNDAAFQFESRISSKYGDANEHREILTYGKGTPMIMTDISLYGNDSDYFIGRAWDYKGKVPSVSMMITGEVQL